MRLFVLPSLLVAYCLASTASAQSPPHALIPAGTESGLPHVLANDNRVAAGSDRNGVREITLEVVTADWRIETADGPGLRVAAVAEAGGPPMIPAPLIRVESGQTLRVTVRNTAGADTLYAFGLHRRPASEPEALIVPPRKERTVEFEAGEAGTYLYRMRFGPELDLPRAERPERDQLAGALVVEPPGGAKPDRVFVINIFGEPAGDDPEGDGVEALTINGRSWPHTELQRLEVGVPVRWRVLNASRRFHPMHLHGFYFDVLARGTATADTLYAPEHVRSAVTEPMRPGTTMLMEWTPTRPGRWLFHCHLSFHVAPGIRLPGAEAADHGDHEVHMAGLVLGIDVAPGPSDLVWEGETRSVHLTAREAEAGGAHRYGFATSDAGSPGAASVPGPPLIFQQHEAVEVTVSNAMSIPTGVHWHGLELDGWADGVPGWSASDGRVSPIIEPGASFTYRLALMRPGTFIYHSHLNDIDQLTGGLYGPLVVLPRGERFEPRNDHLIAVGVRRPNAEGRGERVWNGTTEPAPAAARVGERHRFRVMHIAPAGQVSAWITRDEEIVPITLLAKDGADLPAAQQVPVDQLAPMGVGETADFTWTPTEPGTYELRVGVAPRHLIQVWKVEG